MKRAVLSILALVLIGMAVRRAFTLENPNGGAPTPGGPAGVEAVEAGPIALAAPPRAVLFSSPTVPPEVRQTQVPHGSRPDADVLADVADERRKILEYATARKLSDMAANHLRLLRASIAVQRGMLPAALQATDLGKLLENQQREVDRLQEDVEHLAKQHRILDLAEWPPEEREGILFVPSLEEDSEAE